MILCLLASSSSFRGFSSLFCNFPFPAERTYITFPYPAERWFLLFCFNEASQNEKNESQIEVFRVFHHVSTMCWRFFWWEKFCILLFFLFPFATFPSFFYVCPSAVIAILCRQMLWRRPELLRQNVDFIVSRKQKVAKIRWWLVWRREWSSERCCCLQNYLYM